MTIRFAAARRKEHGIVARVLSASLPLHPANDNTASVSSDRLVNVALRHFARHGLRAAQVARDNAEGAWLAGDRTGYQWWLAICRTLDRRMADRLAARPGR